VRRIVALGGGGFSMEPDNPLLDDHILALSGAVRPRVVASRPGVRAHRVTLEGGEVRERPIPARLLAPAGTDVARTGP
jgi:hypothetical protein